MQNCFELIPILPGRAGGGRCSSTKYDSSTGTTLYDKVLLTRCFGIPSWTGDAFSIVTKYNETSFPLRGASKVTIQTQQITAPAAQNERHPSSASHMKRHFQCVEQVKSPSNLTKLCACHAKWIASFIRIAYETSFPLRGASKVTLQTQQILRLPRKKCMSSMICVTYETSFPMRGASKVTLQPHQILRLPRKMNVINDLRHIWNLISNAWSKSSHPPTSPNTAPATQNECHQWSASHMKPHFQCVEQVKSPSNLTKYCACHEILKLKISADTPWMLPPIERRFEDNPTISDDIRGYPRIIRR